MLAKTVKFIPKLNLQDYVLTMFDGTEHGESMKEVGDSCVGFWDTTYSWLSVTDVAVWTAMFVVITTYTLKHQSTHLLHKMGVIQTQDSSKPVFYDSR